MIGRCLPLALAVALCACTASIKSAKDFRPINPSLYDLIQPYNVADAAQMPWTYQSANPAGRPPKSDIMGWWDPPSLSYNKTS